MESRKKGGKKKTMAFFLRVFFLGVLLGSRSIVMEENCSLPLALGETQGSDRPLGAPPSLTCARHGPHLAAFSAARLVPRSPARCHSLLSLSLLSWL